MAPLEILSVKQISSLSRKTSTMGTGCYSYSGGRDLCAYSIAGGLQVLEVESASMAWTFWYKGLSSELSSQTTCLNLISLVDASGSDLLLAFVSTRSTTHCIIVVFDSGEVLSFVELPSGYTAVDSRAVGSEQTLYFGGSDAGIFSIRLASVLAGSEGTTMVYLDVAEELEEDRPLVGLYVTQIAGGSSLMPNGSVGPGSVRGSLRSLVATGSNLICDMDGGPPVVLTAGSASGPGAAVRAAGSSQLDDEGEWMTHQVCRVSDSTVAVVLQSDAGGFRVNFWRFALFDPVRVASHSLSGVSDVHVEPLQRSYVSVAVMMDGRLSVYVANGATSGPWQRMEISVSPEYNELISDLDVRSFSVDAQTVMLQSLNVSRIGSGHGVLNCLTADVGDIRALRFEFLVMSGQSVLRGAFASVLLRGLELLKARLQWLWTNSTLGVMQLQDCGLLEEAASNYDPKEVIFAACLRLHLLPSFTKLLAHKERDAASVSKFSVNNPAQVLSFFEGALAEITPAVYGSLRADEPNAAIGFEELGSMLTYIRCALSQLVSLRTADEVSQERVDARLEDIALLSEVHSIIAWFYGSPALAGLLGNAEAFESIGRMVLERRKGKVGAVASDETSAMFYSRQSMAVEDESSSIYPHTSSLFVDRIVESLFGPGQRGVFPPTSFDSLLELYRKVPAVHLIRVRLLVLYILMDLCAEPSLANTVSADEVLLSFADHFDVSSDLVSVVQGYWLLDTAADVERAAVLLSHVPKIVDWPGDVIEWLMALERPDLAVRFALLRDIQFQRPDSAVTVVEALLAADLIWPAFEVGRHLAGVYGMQAPVVAGLYGRIFAVCLESSRSDLLVSLPMTGKEEACFLSFCKARGFRSLARLFLVHRARFSEVRDVAVPAGSKQDESFASSVDRLYRGISEHYQMGRSSAEESAEDLRTVQTTSPAASSPEAASAGVDRLPMLTASPAARSGRAAPAAGGSSFARSLRGSSPGLSSAARRPLFARAQINVSEMPDFAAAFTPSPASRLQASVVTPASSRVSWLSTPGSGGPAMLRPFMDLDEIGHLPTPPAVAAGPGTAGARRRSPPRATPLATPALAGSSGGAFPAMDAATPRTSLPSALRSASTARTGAGGAAGTPKTVTFAAGSRVGERASPQVLKLAEEGSESAARPEVPTVPFVSRARFGRSALEASGRDADQLNVLPSRSPPVKHAAGGTVEGSAASGAGTGGDWGERVGAQGRSFLEDVVMNPSGVSRRLGSDMEPLRPSPVTMTLRSGTAFKARAVEPKKSGGEHSRVPPGKKKARISFQRPQLMRLRSQHE